MVKGNLTTDAEPTDKAVTKGVSLDERLERAIRQCLLALIHSSEPERVLKQFTDCLTRELNADYCVLLDAGSGLSGIVAMGDLPCEKSLLADWLQALERDSENTPYFSPDDHAARLIFPLRYEHRFCGGLVVQWPTAESYDTTTLADLAAICPVLAEMLINVSHGKDQRRHDLYDERATISRELHDSLAQSLTYLKIQATRLQVALTPQADQPENKAALDVLTELRTNLNDAYRQLRGLMTTFRLTMHGKSFKLAVRDSIDEFNKYNNMVFELNDRCPAGILTVDEEMQALQVIREALYNIVKHSQATTAVVSLHYQGALLVISIKDDGVGFSREQKSERHHGLTIMQERAFNLGGKLRVSGMENKGTEISISFAPKLSES